MRSHPLLTIEPSIRPHIRDIQFDQPSYVQYLSERGVAEDEIDHLELAIEKNSGDRHGFYVPRDVLLNSLQNRDRSQRVHKIYIDPDQQYPGRALRHQSEHLIYDLEHPRSTPRQLLVNIGQVALLETLGAIGGIAAANRLAFDAGLEMNFGGQIFAGELGGLAGCGLYMLLFSARLLSMSELKAKWAEQAHKGALPDSVLQIEYDNRPVYASAPPYSYSLV